MATLMYWLPWLWIANWVFSAKMFNSHTIPQLQSMLSEEFTTTFQFICILHAKHVKIIFLSDLRSMTHKKHTPKISLETGN